MLSVKNVALEE